jgi:hypothetical protein
MLHASSSKCRFTSWPSIATWLIGPRAANAPSKRPSRALATAGSSPPRSWASSTAMGAHFHRTVYRCPAAPPPAVPRQAARKPPRRRSRTSAAAS